MLSTTLRPERSSEPRQRPRPAETATISAFSNRSLLAVAIETGQPYETDNPYVGHHAYYSDHRSPIHGLQVSQVLPSTVDASTGLGGYQGALGFVRPRVPGRGIGVVSVRGVCVGRAPDLWCTSNGPSVTTWGSSSSGTMACRRHSVNRAPARPGARCGP